MERPITFKFNSIHFIVMLLVLSQWVAVEGVLVCPSPASSTQPCSCQREPLFGGDKIWLNCQTLGLNDSRVNEILDSLLAPNVSPLFRLSLQNNQLTKVPTQLSLHKFSELEYIYLDNNLIRTITKGAFDLVTKVGQLSLESNAIDTVEPDAFLGNFGPGTYIYLAFNNLTRFESDSFQSVLEKYTNIFIQNNPFDCVTDSCHLTWLIRDNPRFLANAQLGKCSNGTAFTELDPETVCNDRTTEEAPSTVTTPPFVCPGPDGNYADPSSCYNYYMCIDNVAFKQTCPLDDAGEPFYYFNPLTGRCDLPSNGPGCQKLK